MKWYAAAMACAITVSACGPAAARSPKPAMPAGVDPGGVSIGILTAGIDYTRAEVAARLARDGEGELVGWDMIDGDNRPYFDPQSNTTAAHDSSIVAEIGAALKARFVPVRVDAARNDTMQKALAFMSQTPVGVVVIGARAAATLDFDRYPQLFFLIMKPQQEAAVGAPSLPPGVLALYVEPATLSRLGGALAALRDCAFKADNTSPETERKLQHLKLRLNAVPARNTKQPSHVDCKQVALLRAPIQ